MQRHKKLGERGIVSIMVTMIMMLVISLIVLGFAQVARRNERESLDRQLSSQAYYAAESGINDATAIIAGGSLTTQPDCKGGVYYNAAKAQLSSENSVKYTCVLVDPTPTNLVYDTVNSKHSVIVPITTATNLSSLSIGWAKQTGHMETTCGGQVRYYFPALTDWNCAFGVLRVDLVQITNPASPPSNADALANATTTLYLTPFGGHTGTLYNIGSSLSFGGSTVAHYGSGCNVSTNGTCPGASTCSSSCVVTFPLSGASHYYARITSLYRDPAKVFISGEEGSNVPAQFLNAQATVDATGQAQDVFRRLQVRLKLTDNADTNPINALSSTATICKRFSIAPGDTAATPAALCQ